MKDLCTHFLDGIKFKKPAIPFAKGTFLSLLLTTCAAFTSCTEKEDFNLDNNKLQVTFGVNNHGSRAINRETSLPDGSQVGARLSGYTGYENLVYTASTGKTLQTWTGDKDVVLSDVSGTLYAYYPYNKDIDITAIPVDMTAADQTDWLYGVPATGITDLNPEVDVTMNHALANINLSIVGDNYAGDGNISSISVQSDGIASKGTFNAAQATPGYTAFTVKGEALERSVATTLGATATDIMVIPTGTEASITFFVTVDDVVYTVKSAPLTLEMGYSYQYTLKLKSTYMSVDGVSVTPWNNVSKEDNLELEKYDEFKEAVIATYYVDEASLTSRAAGVEVQLLSSSNNFYISLIDRMQVDGVEVTPAKTYTFTSGGSHTVKYMLKDNTILPHYMFNGTNVTEMTIPNSVQTIGESAFSRCTGLTSIDIPNSVTSIGEYTFLGCTGLKEVVIPNSVTTIGEKAFSGCSGLTGTLTIPNLVKSIGYYAFQNCTGLTGTLTIPSLVTSIGNYAFSGCSGLTEVTIGSGVQTIGASAFSGCTGLTGTLTIPNSVQTIGESAFNGCLRLTGTLTIPSLVTSIGQSAFEGCKGLTSVVIPESVTSIGDRAFTLCTGLTGTLTIPGSVTSIGSQAFRECTGLTGVTIPESVTSIGKLAFYNCTGFNSIVVESGNTVYDSRGNCNAIMETTTNTLIVGCKNTVIPDNTGIIVENAFYNCSGLTEMTIPNTVTKIGASAFCGCTGLTGVTIGSGVQTIGDYAFSGCFGLNKITSLSTSAPAIQSYTFINVKSNGTLYVPAGATGYDAWMETDGFYLGKKNWTMQEITE